METNVHVLPNGIRVLMIKDDSTEAGSVGVFVRTGAGNETLKQHGVSHFLEHMAFKGTDTKSYRDIAVAAEILGANMNAYTSQDTTAYYIDGLGKHINKFAVLLGEIVTKSIFPVEELEKERNVIEQEFWGYYDDPNSRMFEAMAEVMHAGSSFGRNILGTVDSIKAISRDDLIAYIDSQYLGENIIIGVYGNYSDTQTLEIIRQEFGAIKLGKNSPIGEIPTTSGHKSVKMDVVQTSSLVGFQGSKSGSINFHSDAVAIGALGRGMSSPLFNRIREELGLVYSVKTGYSPSEHEGAVYIYAGLNGDDLPKYYDALGDLLRSHRKVITDMDVTRALNMKLVSLSNVNEDGSKQLQWQIEQLFLTGRLGDLSAEKRHYEEVTKEDVASSLDRMMSGPMVSVVVSGEVMDDDQASFKM